MSPDQKRWVDVMLGGYRNSFLINSVLFFFSATWEVDSSKEIEIQQDKKLGVEFQSSFNQKVC